MQTVQDAAGNSTGFKGQRYHTINLDVRRECVLNEIIWGYDIGQASSQVGDTVLDFWAGSGTVGESAHALGRRFVLVDQSADAVKVMRERFTQIPSVDFIQTPAAT